MEAFDNFFLPFRTIAVEDPYSVVFVWDTANRQEGLEHPRGFMEFSPYSRFVKTVDLEDPTLQEGLDPKTKAELQAAMERARNIFIITEGVFQSLRPLSREDCLKGLKDGTATEGDLEDTAAGDDLEMIVGDVGITRLLAVHGDTVKTIPLDIKKGAVKQATLVERGGGGGNPFVEFKQRVQHTAASLEMGWTTEQAMNAAAPLPQALLNSVQALLNSVKGSGGSSVEFEAGIETGSLERQAMFNAMIALQEIAYLNDRAHFIVEAAPVKEKPAKPGRIRRAHERPVYTILKPGAARRLLGVPTPAGVPDGTGTRRAPHDRRRHKRTLRSDRFTHKRGEVIIVKECWIGPSESVRGNHKYRVLLDR